MTEGEEDRSQLEGTREGTKLVAGVDALHPEPCKGQLMEVLKEIADDPGGMNVTEHHIKTDDSAPTNQQAYRPPVQWKETLAMQPFSYKVEHRAGDYHGNTHGLSKQVWRKQDCTPVSDLLKGREMSLPNPGVPDLYLY